MSGKTGWTIITPPVVECKFSLLTLPKDLFEMNLKKLFSIFCYIYQIVELDFASNDFFSNAMITL